MKITFRKSVESDEKQLEILFYECFGGLAKDCGALSPIINRYFVAEYNGEIIAATGILPLEKSEYNGYEITWTATKKEYRKQGLIVKMLELAEKELPNDGIPLFCDCWRIQNNEKINLDSVMKHMEMKEIIKDRINRKYPYNLECNNCCFKKENCFCSGSLYIKYRKY